MYHSIAKVYEYIFPAGGKVKFLSESFEGKGRLLDVGCSDGRVALGLAELGYDVVASDLSQGMIDVALDVSDHQRHFKVALADMLDTAMLFDAQSFDGVYCVGNTLVHLPNKDLVLKALKGFRAVLKPGMPLVVQILNYDKVYKDQVKSLALIDNDHVRFERTYTLNDDKVIFSTRLTDKASEDVFEDSTPLLPLKKNELEGLLLEAGFVNLEWMSGFDGRGFDEQELPLIVVAK